nr:LTA synthase family protein [Pantoea varia]
MKFLFRWHWGYAWLLLAVYASITYVQYNSVTYILPTLVEIFFIRVVLFLLIKYAKVHLALIKVISIFLVFCILLQLQFVQKSGAFITVLSLWNRDSADFINISVSSYFPFAFFLILFFISRPISESINKKFTVVVSLGSVLLYCGVVYANVHRQPSFSEWRSPLLSIVTTMHNYIVMNRKLDAMKENSSERERIYNEFKHYTIYQPDEKNEELVNKTSRKPNVVVFFVEGMSANIIDYYGGKYKDLTPNIDQLADSSLVFKNYYNHTAATFRGLRGQLTSTYQYIGGTDASAKGLDQLSSEQVVLHTLNKLTTLPNILRDEGYNTYFISPHYQGANLNTMLSSLGFDRVYTRADDTQFKGSATEPLSDKALIDFLIKKTKSNKAPFFIGLYNFGTHLTMNSPDIKYKDGRSIVLNRFHNLDAQVGRYIKYLKESGMSKDTIFVLTSDHASFPAPEFTSVINTKNNYFNDKIPLIIFREGFHHQVIDAKGKNSVNFAPTLLNILNIAKAKNYFMGCSLLDRNCHPVANISAYGDSFFITDQHNVYPEFAVPESLKEQFTKGKEWVWKGYKMTDNAH